MPQRSTDGHTDNEIRLKSASPFPRWEPIPLTKSPNCRETSDRNSSHVKLAVDAYSQTVSRNMENTYYFARIFTNLFGFSAPNFTKQSLFGRRIFFSSL